MPPEISSAMRSPRSSSGTGVGSSGIGLSLPLPRLADDLQDLGDRALDVVVGYHVVVARGVGHLFLGDPAPGVEIFRRLASAALLAVGELLLRGGDDKDGDRIWHEPAHL